jgi:hypothetical protein
MPKLKRTKYPDARLSGMKPIFELIRTEPSWRPNPIDKDTLSALGIAKGKEPNALFALRFLVIIDENNSPTKNFDDLRSDFQLNLRGLVQSSYARLVQMIPASRINQASLVRFFRTNGYSEETAEYQAKLFVYLCNEAGIELPTVETRFKRARFRKKISSQDKTNRSIAK